MSIGIMLPVLSLFYKSLVKHTQQLGLVYQILKTLFLNQLNHPSIAKIRISSVKWKMKNHYWLSICDFLDSLIIQIRNQSSILIRVLMSPWSHIIVIIILLSFMKKQWENHIFYQLHLKILFQGYQQHICFKWQNRIFLTI